MTTYSPAQFTQLLKKQYADYLVIGVTGHRDLLVGDVDGMKTTDALKQAVQQKLKDLTGGRPILLVSGLAMGADQLVAECIEGIAAVLCVPLPLSTHDYVESGFTGNKDNVTGYYEKERDYFNDRISQEETVKVKLPGKQRSRHSPLERSKFTANFLVLYPESPVSRFLPISWAF